MSTQSPHQMSLRLRFYTFYLVTRIVSGRCLRFTVSYLESGLLISGLLIYC